MRRTLQTLALSSLLCLGLNAGLAVAQDAPQGTQQGTATADQGMQNMHRRAPMTTEEQITHMTRALDLTADQQTQIKPLLDARREQMMQVHQDQSMSRDDKMAKMKTLDEDTHAKIAAVLNDQQKAKFEKMAQRREQHWNGGGQAQQPQQ